MVSLKICILSLSVIASCLRLAEPYRAGEGFSSSTQFHSVAEIKQKLRKGRSKVDVVVVGAGYSGLVSALELARAGYSVAVVSNHTAAHQISSARENRSMIMIFKGLAFTHDAHEWSETCMHALLIGCMYGPQTYCFRPLEMVRV